MSKKQKRELKRIVIALALFILVFIANIICKNILNYEQGLASIIDNKYGWLLPFILYLLIYIYVGYDVIKKAFLNIFSGKVLDENFLMVIATFGAFSLGIYRALKGMDIEGFDEACAVLLFYQVGEWFQNYAVSKSRKSISSLMDIRPDYANLLNGEDVIKVSPEEVKINDIIVVYPGEKIPLDGILVEGVSTVDTSSLTGESLPLDVKLSSNLLSGSVNLTQTIKVKVEKEFQDSTVNKILNLVENASNLKSKSENFITKFAKYYTPIVVICAILLAIIPTIITKDFSIWLYRALNFLVVSCPCALVISIPLSFFAGLGCASGNGILVKGSVYLEKINELDTLVLDKTGTLTKGTFNVVEVHPLNRKEEILRLASIAEKDSSHPIALSIKKEYKDNIKEDYTLTNIEGMGIKAYKDDDIIYCGNDKLMEKYNINYIANDTIGTKVYVAHNNKFIGSIVIADTLKESSFKAIKDLNNLGIKTLMLTGDNEEVASDIVSKLSLSSYKCNLLPQDKVSEFENILKIKKGNVGFVGDGINDAPVLMRADIGISMGQIGSDAAIEASDVVLMNDNLNDITTLIKISKGTLKIVKQNIIFALSVKLLILILSAFGYANMWLAVIGDVGVAFLAILNSLRCHRLNNK